MPEQQRADGRVDELKRALVAIRDLRQKVQQLEASVTEPIAVVGMSCRFPGGASTPERYWDLLRGGVDATREVPPGRWDVDAIYNPDPDAPGCMYTRRGGFIDEPVDQFDASFFGISPREAAAMDPVQRLLLELTWEALEHASIPPQSLHGSDTAVFVGVSPADYNTLQQRNESLSNMHVYRGTGSAACIAGGRISHVFGLQGPNLTLDTACSSSLVAVTLGVENLRAGHCRVALAGGAQLMLAPDMTVYMCRMRALSPGGRCRTFDAAADGYSRGEGGAMIVLKRLTDAQADGDRIFAVIRGAAFNHDGHSSGLTVPNPAAQRAVIEAALRDARVSPDDVDYVEAHGTATPLGDPIEVRAMADVLCRTRPQEHPLLIGSAKTNVGHLEVAAGAAGLMKVVLSIAHGEIPPHLNCDQPTPHVDWDNIPVRIARQLTPWQSRNGRRVAGVSAFGLSGTNAHVIVENAPPAPVESPSHPGELMVVSGKSRAAVREVAQRYRDCVAAGPSGFANVALTSVAGRSPLSYRATAVAADAAEMIRQLDAIADAPDESIAWVRPGGRERVAFLFTGQGAQYPGMGRELIATSPTARKALARCDEILRSHLDRSLLELLTTEADADVVRQTKYAQPLLFAIEYALVEVWKAWGVEPSFVAGHSLGEYVAAVVAGVMTLEEALPLVVLRGKLMQELPGGGRMTAALAPEAQVAAMAAQVPGVSIAAVNGPASTVLSGAADDVAEVVRRLADAGVECKDLHVSHAFHSALMDPMLERFEAAVRALRLAPPRLGLVSNVTGQLMSAPEAVDPVRWRRHVREPVRFAQSLRTLYDLGVRTFVEIGPHPALSAMGTATIPEPGTRWLPSMRRGRSAWQQLLETAADLWRSGYDLDAAGYAREHGGRRAVIPSYAFQRERHWFTDATPARPPRTSARDVHPLIGGPFRSPAIEGWIFESELDADNPSYLAEHRVNGSVVVAAAAFVEMMLAAAKHGPGWARPALHDFTIERPLVVGDAGVMCQTIVSAPQGGAARVRIVAAEPAGDAPPHWSTIATGTLEAEPASAFSAPSLESLRSAGDESVDLAALYAGIERLGVQYGASFRALRQATKGAGGAIGRAELSAGGAGRHVTHPCLVDAAFQLLGVITGTGTDETSAFLPAGIESLRFAAPLGDACWIHARLRPTNGTAPDTLAADFVFFDEDGRPLGMIQGYHGRRVHRVIAATDSVYDVRWEEVSLGERGEVSGTWLLLEDAGGVGAALAQALGRAGVRSVRVRPGAVWAEHGRDEYVLAPDDETAWSRLAQAAGLTEDTATHVVHLWSLDPLDLASGGGVVEGQMLDSSVVLATLLRDDHLAGHAGAALSVITRGAAGPDSPSGEAWSHGAPFWGALPVIRAEHPEISARVVDVGGAPMNDGDALLAVLTARIDEDRLVMRGDGVLAPRLQKAVLHAAAHRAAVRSDGAYLVTGGTGGIGRAVVEWLVNAGAGAVVLAARSALEGDAAAWLEDVRARGARVECARGDVSSYDDVATMVATVATTGLPLRGVFHVAGAIDDGLLRDLDRARFARVFAPKVRGAINLHAATTGHALDHFVLFSSTASLIGGPGQAAYAAANAFLGALAAYRRAEGLPGLSIDWGAWGGAGMVARLSDRERRMLEDNGLRFLEPRKALATLGTLLSSGVHRVAVAEIGWDRVAEATRHRPLPLLRALLARAEGTVATPVPAVDVVALRAAPPAERRERVDEYVRTTLAAVLGLRPDQVTGETEIAALGFDSLMAMELRNRVETQLGVLVPVATLLRATVTSDISEEVAASLVDAQPMVTTTAARAGWMEGEI